jgi:hypothetical protein
MIDNHLIALESIKSGPIHFGSKAIARQSKDTAHFELR